MGDKSNYRHYEDSEFNTWAWREQLIPAERFLIDKFLDKNISTLEAGTGGGCILHALKKEGFPKLSGFDYLPAFIDVAKKRDKENQIDFIVADAASLPYEDNKFGQAIYLQQIISMIDDSSKRASAVKEAYRVLQPGGIALFSFLCYESRARQSVYRIFLAYLKVFRTFFHRGKSIQLQPWLKHRHRFNILALLDRPPYLYWYKVREAMQLLESNGFEVFAAASEKEVKAGITVKPADLYNGDVTGMLYLVARKK